MADELHLFEGYGIEVEYMIVDASELDVRPISDRILRGADGNPTNELERPGTGWSNELVLHLLEVKNAAPNSDLSETARFFHRDVVELNGLFGREGARLMPTAMHPWMLPPRETELWPHEYHEIYESFDRLFDCRRHGWANLQSVQINLPFWGDDEFARLHAAIRLVLPLLPALAASSPLKEGRITGHLDTRLETYATNAASVPILTGDLVPEPIYTQVEYKQQVLEPIDQLRKTWPHADELEAIWLNARGAIARFDRNAIEIRIVDTQECPLADLAVVSAAIEAVRYLVERETPAAEQLRLRSYATGRLRTLLEKVGREGGSVAVTEEVYLAAFGFGSRTRSVREIWKEILDARGDRIAGEFHGPLQKILDRGCLAERILAALPQAPGRDDLQRLYRQLCGCLADNNQFV